MEVQLVAFLVASIVIIVVPGVDFALITRQVVGHGRRAGFITLAGLVAGGLVHAGLATVGLSVLLLTSAQLYSVVRLAGAAYLVYVGVVTLISMIRAMRLSRPTEESEVGRTAAVDANAVGAAAAQSTRSAFLLGVVSNLLNVKVVVFYVTFLPQFVTPGPGAAARTATLAAVFIALAVIWWICYIALLDQIGRWIRRPKVQRVVEGLTGGVLAGLGVKIALDV